MPGNEDAVRALYARYARPIFTLGLRLLGSAEAAEELTQDVFLAAWRKAARFDPARGRLSTWLMTIAHNLAVDRLRRETGVTRPHLVLVDEVPEARVGGRGGAADRTRRGDPRPRVALGRRASGCSRGRTSAGSRLARSPRRRDPARNREDAAAHGADQGAPRQPGQGAAVTCLEVRELLPEHAIGVLGELEHERIQRHLQMCAGCREGGRRSRAGGLDARVRARAGSRCPRGWGSGSSPASGERRARPGRAAAPERRHRSSPRRLRSRA